MSVFEGMSSEINRLIVEGVIKLAPLRARSLADVPRVRAALAKR
jgi:hypothetical protein